MKIHPIIEGLFEDTGTVSIDYRAIASKIRSKCGPFVKANKTNFQSGHLLYRGVKGTDVHKIGEVLELTVRKDRVPLDSSEIFHNTMNQLLSKYGGIHWRSESLFAVASPTIADSYGPVVVAVFPIGKYQILKSDEVRDVFSELAPPIRVKTDAFRRHFQGFSKWRSMSPDHKKHGTAAISVLEREVIRCNIPHRVYEALRATSKELHNDEIVAVVNAYGRETFTASGVKSIAAELINEFGSTVISDIKFASDAPMNWVHRMFSSSFDIYTNTIDVSIDQHDINLVMRAFENVMAATMKTLIDTIVKVCEAILMDIVDSYYLDDMFEPAISGYTAGEQMIACERYLAVVVSDKRDDAATFNILSLLGELSK